MELNELKKLWQSYGETLEPQVQINRRLLKEVSIRKVHSLLLEFKSTAIIELVANSLFSIFLIQFIAGHWGSFKFTLPAVALLLLMVSGLAWSIYLLSLMSQVKAELPVIRAQRIVGRLRLYEYWETKALYVIIPVFSGAFLVVLAKALVDLDIYALVGSWLIGFVAGSLAVAVIIVWFLKRFPDQRLRRAERFLDEISAFEGD